MKQPLFLVALFAFCSTSFAQQNLPVKANDFIKTYFSKDSMVSFEKDTDDIEIYLSNGNKISFLLNGEWKEVDGKGKTITNQFIPDNILKSIKASFPQANIVKIEKEHSKYEVKLDNNMDIDIDFKGKIIKQKLDN